MMATSPGPKSFNADRCWVWPGDGLFVVADGAGSGPAGEAASIAGRVFSDVVVGWLRSQATVDPRQLAQTMGAAVNCAHREVEEFGADVGRFAATTLVAVASVEGGVVCCSVGDSSAALFDMEGSCLVNFDGQQFTASEGFGLIGSHSWAPHVEQVWGLPDQDMVLVLGSDGVADLASLACQSSTIDLRRIVELVDRCGSETGDNATLIAVRLASDAPEPVDHARFTAAPGEAAVRAAQAILDPLNDGRLDLLFDPVAVVGRVSATGVAADSLNDVARLMLQRDSGEGLVETVIAAAASLAATSGVLRCL